MKIKTASFLLVITLTLIGMLVITATLYSLSNVYQVKSTWVHYQAVHSDKDHAINILRSEIGYGGMIHNFKNYILRREEVIADAVKSSLGGAKAAITLYRSLDINQHETEALNHIEQNLQAYGNSLPIIAKLIKHGKTSIEIDRVVKISDARAISGLSTLVKQSKADNTSEISKARIVDSIRDAIGFNGMIHHFKNAILRSNPELLIQAESGLNVAHLAIQSYFTFDVNHIERQALLNIQNTLGIYRSKIKSIKLIDLKNTLPEKIDQLAKVNDKPALDGFATLGKEILLQTNLAEKDLGQNLQSVINAGKIVVLLTVVTILLFIGGSYLFVQTHIIKPIANLTHTITNIANKNLDVEIYGIEKSDEIGKMARSVKIFKQNIIRLDETKKKLKTSNELLESRVINRTKELEDSEKMLRSIFETAVDAIITIDKNGIIQSFNQAALNMFDYNSNEIIGESVGKLMPESDEYQHYQYLEKYIQTGNKKIIGVARETEARRRSGHIFPILLSISEVKFSNDILFTGIIRDISEIKTYQKNLENSEKMAREANNVKSNFIANMNHELRTPINAVLGFTQLLECNPAEPLTQIQNEFVEEIKTAGSHLLDMINQILQLNQIEAGKLNISMCRTNPFQFINESLALLGKKIGEKKITVVDQINYDLLPDLYTDPLKFKQVLINLLSNAIKYNKPSGKITLRSEIRGNRVRFSVEDTGYGIPVDRQAETFLPFERLGHESGAIEGTGIGLSISKEIVEEMVGEIGFSSEENIGSCFWFELPIYRSA